ncbi:unnamed protein product [Prorocentrum cordatum]|uniref:Ion transport domain-containing protein n=1 Tax=Prorocentrum cordatum TaxID=2364126 RepID=A0ABN9X5L9_9DINO|nr:unnamed protein product [Polarella glacialis]
MRPPWWKLPTKFVSPPWGGQQKQQWQAWRDIGSDDDLEGWHQVGQTGGGPWCSKCGCKKNSKGSKFCKACGHKLSDISPAVAAEPAGVWSEQRRQHGDADGKDGKGGKKGKKGKDSGKGDGGKGGKGGRVEGTAGGDPAKLPRAPGAQFLVAQEGPSVELEFHELEQLVATLEKLGDTVSLAKHRRTLQERRRLQQEALYVPPLSQRVTQAHKQVQDIAQKLGKAVLHFERLEEGLESQRRWVQSLCEDMESKKAEHRKLVVELNRQVVDISQDSTPSVAPISVAGILDGSIEEIPLSFAGLGFDDEEYEMDANDKTELADRSARLKSELSNAVKQMFGQAAEKAKLFKEEQEAMALRLAGKRRRQGSGGLRLRGQTQLTQRLRVVGGRPWPRQLDLFDQRQYCKQLCAVPEAVLPEPLGQRPAAMGLPPDAADPEWQAIQDFNDMRADLRDWAAAWFDSCTELETDSGHWRRWCKAFLGAMLAGGGNEPLRRLLRIWFPGWHLDNILDELCLSGWRQSEPRRIAFLVRLNSAQPLDRWRLEHAHWRQLAQIRVGFEGVSVYFDLSKFYEWIDHGQLLNAAELNGFCTGREAAQVRGERDRALERGEDPWPLFDVPGYHCLVPLDGVGVAMTKLRAHRSVSLLLELLPPCLDRQPAWPATEARRRQLSFSNPAEELPMHRGPCLVPSAGLASRSLWLKRLPRCLGRGGWRLRHRAPAAMDFQQLLCQLAGEHRRLEQERNELSEEVSRLRKRLSGGKAELPPEAAPLPGHVTSPTGAPRRSADSDGGTPEQLGVVAVRALAARQLKSEAAETEGHFVSVSVEAGPPSTTPTQQGPDTEWRGFTAGLLAQPHQKTLELRVFESLGEGQSPRNAGSSSVGFRALAPGVWQKRACELGCGERGVEFEVSWQPGADGVGSAGLRGGGAEARSAPVRGRSRHNTETEWLDDREQMNRARQKVRFLEVFGLDASQQGTYTVTAESLGQVLAKRGLRNVKDGFLLKALQELERVAQSKASSCGASVDSRTSALSSVVPPPVGSLSGSARLDKGIGFEIFVDAVLMSDLPKRVHPRLSRGVEKMQEALLKQDVEEVIAKLSRKRESLAMDVSVDGLAPTPKSSKVDTVLNTFVSLTVLASIVCLGLSRESDPDWEGWLILEAVFAVIFIAEINIKILMHGSRTYWCGPDRRWNWLDFTVTVVSVGDVCLNLVIQNLSDELEFSRLALVCRVFRLMRLGRVLKMIRSPLIRELSNMLVGFVLGSPALFWVSIIIWVVVALVAMSLRIAVGAHPDEQMLVEKCGHPDLFVVTEDADPTCAKHKLYAEEYCGSLSKCMFTVFRCMIGDCTSTGGQSLAAHLSAGFGTKFDFVYLTGMIVMIFGLFNVITAISHLQRWRG